MLSVLLWAPVAAAILVLSAPRLAGRWIAVLGTLVALGLAIALVADFESGSGTLQHTVDESWIPDLGVRYSLGIDGISLFLVLITAVLWFAATLFSALRGYPDDGGDRFYYSLLLLGEFATLGAFMAQDLLLFVLFFDLMLVPFFFLVGAFGGENRIAATTKMIVYTLVGSLLMLVAAIATAILVSQETGELSFSLAYLRENLLSTGSQEWIFALFAFAFLVKMPAFPIHGWMPDAYRAAPLPVLALLSAVLSKVGAYGFLRVAFPTFPEAAVTFQELILLVGVASILYGSAMAFTQTNLRLIAGYSSVAQLGFITVGLFALRPDGAEGAVLQMVNHALITVPIFLIIAVVYERTRTDDLRGLGGMAMRAPVLAALFLVVTMATLAMPGSANFIGEFYILNALFQSKIVYAIVASAGVALAAFYALRMYQRTMHNRLPDGLESRELSLGEGVVLAPLVACIVALALYPGLILERGEAAVADKVGAVAAARGGGELVSDSDTNPPQGGRGWTGYAPVAESEVGPIEVLRDERPVNHDRVPRLSRQQCERLRAGAESLDSASLADDYVDGCKRFLR